jgi:hypothetical protein
MSKIMSATEQADALLEDACPPGREQKSVPYLTGARQVLLNRLTGSAIANPYRMGTAAYDAFEAGKLEGKVISKQAGLKKAVP